MTLQKSCILLANGKFPEHKIPLDIIIESKNIICLDGAVNNLVKYNLEPSIIIGDLDSIDFNLKKRYSEIIIEVHDQSKNDLVKGLDWLDVRKYSEVTILGATGTREDHSIANIFIILEKNYQMDIKMITDYGIFQIIKERKSINSFRGQPVSLFTVKKDAKITTYNLKYQLNKSSLITLFSGSLNESISDSFNVEVDKGPLLLYTAHSK
tara:strand:+ start:671 stop:1300 length:630 start_codon:yes stop_codon:yes gene_type:complete